MPAPTSGPCCSSGWPACGRRADGATLGQGRLDRLQARIDTNLVARAEKGHTAAGVRDVDLSDAAIAALTTQKAATFLKGEHIWANPERARGLGERRRSAARWGAAAEALRRALPQPLPGAPTFASAALTARETLVRRPAARHVDVQLVFTTTASSSRRTTRSRPTVRCGLLETTNDRTHCCRHHRPCQRRGCIPMGPPSVAARADALHAQGWACIGWNFFTARDGSKVDRESYARPSDLGKHHAQASVRAN